MVVGPAPDGAELAPAAHVAVLDWVRIGTPRRIGGWICLRADRGLESVTRGAVVGHEVVDPEMLDGASAAPECHVHQLRTHLLDGRQHVDVGADLEQRAGLDVSGQLRVRDLVVVRAEPARLGVDLEQEIGVAAPSSVEEGRLVDDVGA